MSNEVKAQNTIDLTSLKELNDTVEKTDQYFWHTETGQDAGAHITEVPKDDFISNPEGGNTLIDSDGFKIRDGLTDLANFAADNIDLGLNSEDVKISMCGKTANIFSQKFADFDPEDDVSLSFEGNITRNGLTFTPDTDFPNLYFRVSGTATADTLYRVGQNIALTSPYGYKAELRCWDDDDEVYLYVGTTSEEWYVCKPNESVIFDWKDHSTVNVYVKFKKGFSRTVEDDFTVQPMLQYGTALFGKEVGIEADFADPWSGTDCARIRFIAEGLISNSELVLDNGDFDNGQFSVVAGVGTSLGIGRHTHLELLNDMFFAEINSQGALVFKSGNTGSPIQIKQDWQSNPLDAFFRAEHQDGVAARFGVGYGGVNHGVWSEPQNRWIFHADSNTVYVAGSRMETHKPSISISTTTGVLDYYEVHRYGNVVQLYIRVRNTSSVAAGGNVFTGNISTTGLRPVLDVKGVAYYGGQSFAADLAPSGAITVRNTSGSSLAPISSGSGVSPTFTYLVS